MNKRTIVGIVVLALAFAASVTPAGAAKTTDPCKTLKQSEIAAALGGATVAAGQRITSSPVPLCRWTVSASSSIPDGSLQIFLQTKAAKTTYDMLKKDTANYQKVSGLKNGLARPGARSVFLLKGTALLSLTGAFADPTTGDTVEVTDQLIQLAKKAAPRV